MWGEIECHRAAFTESGELARKRARQQIKWMWALLEERLLRRALDDPAVKARLAAAEQEVASGALWPEAAVARILGGVGALG
jgi:LAO/AO transport system kinase